MSNTKKIIMISLIAILAIFVTIITLLKVSNYANKKVFLIILISLLLSVVLIMITNPRLSKVLKEVIEWTYLILISVGIVLTINFYFIHNSKVVGSSMEPTLTNNKRVFVRSFAYKQKVNDVVIYDSSNNENIYSTLRSDDSKYYVKRIAALEGDVISIKEYKEDNKYVSHLLYINDELYTNKYGEVYNIKFGTVLYDQLFFKSHTLEKDEVLILGDNEANSYDGRGFGFVKSKDIIGKVLGY